MNNNFEQISLKTGFMKHNGGLFFKEKSKPGFYLQGDVGVGKTMILNFFFDNFKHSKQRLHFNEFMINFHDFVFKNKDGKQENIIHKFVNKLKKKNELIYFDEFKVTNIVDAMILGNIFKKIFVTYTNFKSPDVSFFKPSIFKVSSSISCRSISICCNKSKISRENSSFSLFNLYVSIIFILFIISIKILCRFFLN